MGWIWMLFVAFAVLSNLMEKAAKERRPSDLPRKDHGGGSSAPKPVAFPPFFFEEYKEEMEKPLPVKEVNAEPESTAKAQPGGSRSQLFKSSTGKSRMNRSKRKISTWDDELDQVFMDGLDITDFSETLEGDTKHGSFAIGLENVQGGKESEQLLSAIVLAQVMARPDFKTIPWKRRL